MKKVSIILHGNRLEQSGFVHQIIVNFDSSARLNIHTVGSQAALYVFSGVNAMLRKVAVAAASKPHVEIKQNGEQFYIKTSTTVRTTEINFLIGEEFNEETVDGRKCKVIYLNTT